MTLHRKKNTIRVENELSRHAHIISYHVHLDTDFRIYRHEMATIVERLGGIGPVCVCASFQVPQYFVIEKVARNYISEKPLSHRYQFPSRNVLTAVDAMPAARFFGKEYIAVDIAGKAIDSHPERTASMS